MAVNRESGTALFAQWKSGNLVVADKSKSTGNYFFVDSGSATGSDAGGSGRSPYAPFLTLDYAFGVNGATANNGDVIIVMPGHAETIATAGAITMDLAGVSVIGLGTGADRPTFTFSATDSTMLLTAASLRLENVLIKPSINAVVSPIVISGADCVIKDVEIQDASATVECVASILTTAGAARLTIDGFEYRGFIAGDAATRVIALVGVVGATIKNCKFWGEVSTAVINFETTLCTDITVHDCYFYNDNVAMTKDIVDTVGSSLWQAVNCFDGKGGYGFSGSSTLALAADDVSAVATAVASQHVVTRTAVASVTTAAGSLHTVTDAAVASLHTVTDTAVASVTTAAASLHTVTDAAVASLHTVTDTAVASVTTAAASLHTVTDTAVASVTTAAASLHTVTDAAIAAVPKCVEKTDGAVLSGADPIFTIAGGPVLAQIYGIVTTGVTGACNLLIQETTTSPAATVNVSANSVAIDDDLAGTSYHHVGATGVFTPTTAGLIDLDPVTVEPTWFFMPAGSVLATGDAARSGVIAWYMYFRPLSPNSTVTAAV